MSIRLTLVAACAVVGMVWSTPQVSARSVVPYNKVQISAKVYFASGSAKLWSRAKPILQAVAKALKSHPSITLVRIEGHTDAKETTDPGGLSQKRATAVARFLVCTGSCMSDEQLRIV